MADLLPPPTPADAGFAMPPEWAPHERTLIAWPTRVDLWGAQLGRAKADYARIAATIARFEPVLMIADRGDGAEAAAACGDAVEVIEIPIDDSWIRDTGPLVLLDPDGTRTAVDFEFNSWGGKFQPYEADAALGRALCEHLGLDRFAAPLVLEGGSITLDGTGTAVTTEQCLLDPNRNPDLTRADIEGALSTWLGVDRVVWLAAGLVEDHDTDGHVDNVAAFIAPGVILAQGTHEPTDPNLAILHDNRGRLLSAGLEVVMCDVLPRAEIGGQSVVVPPLNLYLVNGGAIVPVVDDHAVAERVLHELRAVLHDREVVGVPGTALAFGGGGVHCITQQVPAVPSAAAPQVGGR